MVFYHQNDPVLMEWARHPKVTAIAKAICGPNIKTLDAMFINKPLDSGEGLSTHPMHQVCVVFGALLDWSWIRPDSAMLTLFLRAHNANPIPTRYSLFHI